MRKLVLFKLLFWSQIILGQFFAPAELIDGEAGIVYSLLAADFDNDNDIDIITAASGLVALYQNLDGAGTFSEPLPIQVGLTQPFSMTTADFDDDNKLDLVVSYFDDDEVWWYKNLGGGNFDSGILLASGLKRASGVVAGDLNGDNDADIVLGVSNGQGLYWIENLPGSGNFGPLIPIDATITQARTQLLADLDGDNDLDVLTNSSGTVYMSWFENTDGLGDFGNQHIVDASGLYENHPYLADVDGDNDVDIVSDKNDQLIWRENLNGLGNFGASQLINANSGDFVNAAMIDVDNDNDIDIVEVGATIKVNWYENLDGMGTFSSRNVIDDTIAAPSRIASGDIDGDGDIDIFVSSVVPNGEKILVWYENLTILGNNSFDSTWITIKPNPTNDVISILCDFKINRINIYDINGRLLKVVIEDFDNIDLASLASGLLFVKVFTDSGNHVERIVKK